MVLVPAQLPEVLAAGALFMVAALGMGAIVLKTVINGLARLKNARQAAPVAAPPPDDRRLAALEEEVRQLRESLERVSTIVEFDHQLRGAQPAPPTRLPGA